MERVVMVIAHHLIWTGHGWWLPNDPRGSMSKTIRNDVIADLGDLHFGRKRVQPAGREIREFYREAGTRLKHDLLTFDAHEREFLAHCVAEVIDEHRYTCYACALMPDHTHIVIRKHKYRAEEMIEHFQEHSRLRFRAEGLCGPDHPVWGGPGWKVFLDTPDDVRRTIRYVELNPIKIGLPAQKWNFVTNFDNWPFHKRK
jgi:REP element-mobilizing transposase RayT